MFSVCSSNALFPLRQPSGRLEFGVGGGGDSADIGISDRRIGGDFIFRSAAGIFAPPVVIGGDIPDAGIYCRGDITASGGVTDISDIKTLRKMNLYGAIIGKAYYTGAIDLKEAIEVAK